MSPVTVDLIIVNYRGARLLEECIASVMRDAAGLPASAMDLRVWVEDNSPLPPRSVAGGRKAGSARGKDGAAAGTWEDALAVVRCHPGLRYSRNPENPGFGEAVNRAAGRGRGELILLLNPDARVEPGFFAAILKIMAARPDIGILGPRIRENDGRIQHSARSFPTFLTGLFGRDSVLSRRFPNHPAVRRNLRTLDISDDISDDIPDAEGAFRLVPVDWVSGACMVIRRAALPDDRVFAAGYFMYWEDADLCRRMAASGFGIRYFTGASVMHHGGASSRSRPARSRAHAHWSAFRIYARMLPAWAGPWLAPAAVILAVRCLAVTGWERFWPLICPESDGKAAAGRACSRIKSKGGGP